jgi:murein DD-endopeptidase MepM/ murein hydrolase activator NlpD
MLCHRFTFALLLLGMCLVTACSTPPPVSDANQIPALQPVRPPRLVKGQLLAPIATQSDMTYAFGETDAMGRAYPGWLLVSDAPTMQLTAMAAGEIVMVIPIVYRKTAFLRIQLRTEIYDIEYIIASPKPIKMPELSQRQRVEAGDVIYEAALAPDEYVAVSVLDRDALTHICPRDTINPDVKEQLEQHTRRLAREWCVTQQLPYNDNALLVPILLPQTTIPQTPATATSVATQTPQSTLARSATATTATTAATAATAATALPTYTAESTVAAPTAITATATGDALGPLRYPVQDVSQIRIMEAFSTDASAPWGFAHNGIDFMTDREREPVIAAASGTITRVTLSRFAPLNNWQVNISLRVNNRYSLAYAIEPMSSDDAVGQAQLALITVQAGQMVTAGDVMGELIGGVNGAHIHWGISDATVDRAVCPAPFLSDTQQRELLARIPSNPDRLCYP